MRALNVDAWVLHAGPKGTSSLDDGTFRREPFRLERPTGDELLVEPLYASWEGNLDHAIARRPIDVCRARGEASLVVGNAGVVRVLEVGPACTGIAPGDLGMVFVGSTLDRSGYSTEIYAYDAPNTVGLLAKQTKLRAHNFIPLPDGDKQPERWAAFSIRYVTAWSNWRVAFGTYRLQMTEADDPTPRVWAWSGGTSFAELDLARRAGCQTAMVSRRPAHLATMARYGITPIDRRELDALEYDEERLDDPTWQRQHAEAQAAFLGVVQQKTGGLGVSIFLDYVGAPLWRLTLKCLGRQGVITTAGWMQGMITSTNRAMECIARHTHVHTHYARRSEALDAMRYALETGWLPEVSEVYTFDDVPQLARDSATSATRTYFPVVRVNPL